VAVEDCDCSVFVPSAFTPNNDGRNDRFMPQMSCEPVDYRFELLDRWGVRFFYTEDPSEGWIGEVPDGEADDRPFFGQQDLYIYRVVAVFEANGVARHQVHTGQVLLLR
jgi:gliding motility-associated-like protein